MALVQLGREDWISRSKSGELASLTPSRLSHRPVVAKPEGVCNQRQSFCSKVRQKSLMTRFHLNRGRDFGRHLRRAMSCGRTDTNRGFGSLNQLS